MTYTTRRKDRSGAVIAVFLTLIMLAAVGFALLYA